MPAGRCGVVLLLLMVLLTFTACTIRKQASEKTREEAPDKDEATEKTTEAGSELSWPLVLRAGYSTNEEDPRGRALQHMKETVEAETDGQIIIKIYPEGKLGSDDQLIEGMFRGKVDMTVSSAGNYALYAPKIGVSALPFLFQDFKSAWSFIDSETMGQICTDLEPYNIHVLAFFDNGFRCVTTTDRPVKSVKDMKDLNIRTPDNQIVMETMSELGARPRSFPFSELKQALADGTFNAQENPIPVIYNNKLYEVQKYLSITNHSYDAMPLTIRQDIWKQLPADYQSILLNAAQEAQAMDRKMVADQTDDYVSLLEDKGMIILHPELDEFKDATAGVMDVFSNVFGEELLQTIKETGDGSLYP